MTHKFEFNGSYWDYFWNTLGWAILIMVTAGITVPFYVVWNVKWFTKNLEIISKK